MLQLPPHQYRFIHLKNNQNIDPSSKQPIKYNPITGQPEEQYQRGRSDSPGTKTYYAYSHSSPYVNGKRNGQFSHPSYISNQIFYNSANDEQLRNVRTPPEKEDTSKQNDKRNRNLNQGTRPFTATNQEKRSSVKEDNYEPDTHYPEERSLRKNEEGRYSSNVQGNYDRDGEKDYRSNDYDRHDHLRESLNNNVRDDRSEASTVVSALSDSSSYICPNCLNRHMINDRKNACLSAKQRDIQNERTTADLNNRLSLEEEFREKQERAKRLNEGRELKDRLEYEYESKKEVRRSPKKEKDTHAFDSLFERQEEHKKHQKNVNQWQSASLQAQLEAQEQRRFLEKQANSSSYNTSLQVGEGYHNKYLTGNHNVTATLQEQVEAKNYKHQREREVEKRHALESSEKSKKEGEYEEQMRRERELTQKRELKQHLLKTIEEKQTQQREENYKKTIERSAVDKGYEEYQRKLAEEEARVKRQLFDFHQAVEHQHEESSYRRQHEEKKHQKEATSFDPSKKTRKIYPCGECSNLYEKVHLTKYHHH